MRNLLITTSFIILGFLSDLNSQAPDTLWTKTFGGSGINKGHSVRQTSDGGCVITGVVDSLGAGDWGWNVWLIKTTPGLPVSVIISESVWSDFDRDGYAEDSLDGSSSYNPDGHDIISHSWTLNDSVISTAVQISLTLPMGLNQVTLTVTDENGYTVVAPFLCGRNQLRPYRT